jgi:hypothetical protein
MGYVGQNDQAQAQMDSAGRQQELMNQQITEQQGQIQDQASLETTERNKQAMIERAQMTTIAGESGALGISSDRLIADSFMQEGTDIMSIERNKQNALKQTQWKGKQAQEDAKSTISKAKGSAGNLLTTGLQIGVAADSYNTRVKAATKAKL